MPKSLAVALAVALRSAGAASVDVSALVQRGTVVRHGEGAAETFDDESWMFQAGQRVELEGYGPDRNVTILSRGRGKERYNLNMEGHGVYSNIEGKFLKAWKEPYPRSTDPEAGPIAHIMHFNYKSKPWIVKRGDNPGTWDVYIPGNGFVPNVPDSDIIREKSWYLSKTHKSKHGPAAVLVGKMPETLPSRSGAKSNRDELVILSKNTEAKPVEVAFPPPKPAARPAAPAQPLQVAPAAAKPEHVALNAVLPEPLQLSGAPSALRRVEVSEAEPAPEEPAAELTGKQRIESLAKTMKGAVDVAMQVAQKGPNKYLIDALPMGLGKVFVNEKAEVRSCGDISSQLYCQTSKSKYNLTCAGWTGTACVSKEEVTSCDVLTSESACHKSKARFGIECVGWGGSSCLSKDSHPQLITSESICQSAEKKLGILVAGWGGSACLSREAACGEITHPGICNSADSKLGLKCLGWGGSSCLAEGSAADQITSESICSRSAEALGIESGGWSGSSCLKADEVKCGAITHPGICRDAWSRLGVHCAGWSGAECLAAEDAACSKLVTKPICQKSAASLGVACAWSGDRCVPDATGKQ